MREVCICATESSQCSSTKVCDMERMQDWRRERGMLSVCT